MNLRSRTKFCGIFFRNGNFKTDIHQIIDERRMNAMSSFGFPSIFYNFEESIHDAK